MSLSITVLGSSGMYATPERACSGYLLEIGDSKLWLDAGAGTWQNLLRHVDYDALDGVLLTHRHPDHTTDLFQAYHARGLPTSRPEPSSIIPLWAPQETVDRITSFAGDMKEAFELRVIAAGGSILFAGATLSFVEMAHPAETVGVRIEHEGSVLSYSADTGPAADFETLAAGAGVLLCEATLQDFDGGWEGHLSATQAGAIASRLGVERLLLTHLPPDRDYGLSLAEAQRSCGDVQVQLAADGLRLEV